MPKFDAKLYRLEYTDKQVTGTFALYRDDQKIFTFETLELPWKDNENGTSCIPTGEYIMTPRSSAKYPKSFLIRSLGKEQVEGRKWILLHPGNYHSQILGCILPGASLADINKDGYKDVTSSKATLLKLIEFTGGQEIHLTISGAQPEFEKVRVLSGEVFNQKVFEVGQEVIVEEDLDVRDDSGDVVGELYRGDERIILAQTDEKVLLESTGNLGWVDKKLISSVE